MGAVIHPEARPLRLHRRRRGSPAGRAKQGDEDARSRARIWHAEIPALAERARADPGRGDRSPARPHLHRRGPLPSASSRPHHRVGRGQRARSTTTALGARTSGSAGSAPTTSTMPFAGRGRSPARTFDLYINEYFDTGLMAGAEAIAGLRRRRSGADAALRGAQLCSMLDGGDQVRRVSRALVEGWSPGSPARRRRLPSPHGGCDPLRLRAPDPLGRPPRAPVGDHRGRRAGPADQRRR